MQKNRAVAAFALFLFIASSTSAFASIRRDPGHDPTEGNSPIQLIVRLIKKIVKPLDDIIIPKP